MPNRKLLLIEDDKTMSMLLKTLLDFEGFETTTFSEGDQDKIINLLKDIQPKILIMDIYINEINGIDLLEIIRKNIYFSDLKVLMTSGMDMQKECLEAGADGFMLKPYLPDELIKWLNEHL